MNVTKEDRTNTSLGLIHLAWAMCPFLSGFCNQADRLLYIKVWTILLKQRTEEFPQSKNLFANARRWRSRDLWQK